MPGAPFGNPPSLRGRKNLIVSLGTEFNGDRHKKENSQISFCEIHCEELVGCRQVYVPTTDDDPDTGKCRNTAIKQTCEGHR